MMFLKFSFLLVNRTMTLETPALVCISYLCPIYLDIYLSYDLCLNETFFLVLH